MRDLTQGSITKHLLSMAAFIGVSMVFQTLYYLADLYFVGKLGADAVAGVSLAGTIAFLVIGVTQMLSVGTTTLIAHAVGKKDQARANEVFNQSFVLSVLIGLALMSTLFVLRNPYCRAVGADAQTAILGEQYLRWFIPAMLVQFGMISMGAGLRGTGIVKPTMLLTVGTLVLNIVLAPILTLGWITHHPFGVAGAAMATFIAMVAGLLGFWMFFLFAEKFLRFDANQWAPRLSVYRDVLKIGTPAGAELALMSVYMLIVYAIIRQFGAAAQAGFGIGGRVMQSMFLPVLAICFSIRRWRARTLARASRSGCGHRSATAQSWLRASCSR